MWQCCLTVCIPISTWRHLAMLIIYTWIHGTVIQSGLSIVLGQSREPLWKYWSFIMLCFVLIFLVLIAIRLIYFIVVETLLLWYHMLPVYCIFVHSLQWHWCCAFKVRLDKFWQHRLVKFDFYSGSDRYRKPIRRSHKVILFVYYSI